MDQIILVSARFIERLGDLEMPGMGGCGFGNLLGTNGSVVWQADPATNRSTTTDANGNSLANSNVWDVENHLVSTLNPNGYQTVDYGYDPWGKRFSQAYVGYTDTVIYFYGLNGRMLQSFDCAASNINGQPQCSAYTANQYFGRKLIFNGLADNQQAVATDRLGSVRSADGSRVSYYPYGQERAQSNGQTTADGTDKFAMYFRDWIGEDYADQRYYNQAGRFFSPDPGGLSTADSSDPSSWNRYAYAEGDPINYYDPEGTVVVKVDPPPDEPPQNPTKNPIPGTPGPGGTKGKAPIKKPNPEAPTKGGSNPCDTSKPLNAQAISWISQHGTDATTAAGKINSTEVIILAISAVESGWGNGDFVTGKYNNGTPINNFFSQHAPAPNGNGTVTVNGNYMETYASYLASALGFDMSQSGILIAGVRDAATAAADLQNAGLYGINPDGTKVANFVSSISSTAAFIANRINCVHQ